MKRFFKKWMLPKSMLSKWICLSLIAGAVLGISSMAYGEGLSTPITPQSTAPQLINFGVYPVKIYDLDPKSGSFKIDFYGWWKTFDKNYKPIDRIEIVNARDYRSQFGAQIHRGNEYITSIHYYATINHNWDMRYFPFDHQTLQVQLEDFGDIHAVRFTPDVVNSKVHSELSLDGWKMIGFHVKESTTTYLTNFGDPEVDKGQFSRITFAIEIERNGWRAYLNYFIGFFMSAFLAILALFMFDQALSISSGLFLGSVFSFIGNKYLVDQQLPAVSGFGFFDVIQMLSLFVIVTAMVSSFFCKGRWDPEKNKRVMRVIAVGVLVLYVLCIGVSTYLANVLS